MSVPYFKSEKIADGIDMISYDFTGRGASVLAYLVRGRDYSLLIDSLMGWGDLKSYCETLTEKPIKLVNTHFHPDHTGGNYQFEACYFHHQDIQYFFANLGKTRQQIYESAVDVAREEYKQEIRPGDFVAEKPIKVYPLYDGDLFDLGGRQVKVVHVGGHTAGSIALIDSKTRICFTGDCCNSNTLLDFADSLPIESYLRSLLHFKKFQREFDICYGGHEILPPSVIDEGIELTARVLARTDDAVHCTGFRGRLTWYGAKRVEGGMQREDGKQFNISYDPNRLMNPPSAPRVIDHTWISPF